MSLLGIDVGTTGCKTVVFSEEGEPLAAAYGEHDIHHPKPGYAELDASQVWEMVRQQILQVTSQVEAGAIRAVAVSSMGEALVPVSADRQVLGPSILNFDARGEEFLEELRGQMDAQRLYRINGNTLGNNYSLTKLIWLKRRQTELYERAGWFLHWSGFISFMLGAEAAVDYSLANRTLLFDLTQAGWSQELIALAGLDGVRLPRPVASGTVIGQVSAAAARDLGLPHDIPIAAGAHDQNANALGCGVIEEGQAVYGMGTFTCITPVFRQRIEPGPMLARGLNTEHHAAPGRYVSFIYNQGGSLLKWYRDTFAPLEKLQAAATGRDIYAELIREIPEPPSEVLVLPHFTVTGPPEFIGNSSGMMVGLKLETSRGEILKGILEGSVYYLKECIDSLPATGIQIREYRAAGGGSKSAAWVQLSADILGARFVRPRITEAGALGAAILAGVGAGIFASVEEGAAAMVKLEQTFEPDPAQHTRYARSYDRYRMLWPLMKDFLQTEKT